MNHSFDFSAASFPSIFVKQGFNAPSTQGYFTTTQDNFTTPNPHGENINTPGHVPRDVDENSSSNLVPPENNASGIDYPKPVDVDTIISNYTNEELARFLNFTPDSAPLRADNGTGCPQPIEITQAPEPTTNLPPDFFPSTTGDEAGYSEPVEIPQAPGSTTGTYPLAFNIGEVPYEPVVPPMPNVYPSSFENLPYFNEKNEEIPRNSTRRAPTPKRTIEDDLLRIVRKTGGNVTFENNGEVINITSTTDGNRKEQHFTRRGNGMMETRTRVTGEGYFQSERVTEGEFTREFSNEFHIGDMHFGGFTDDLNDEDAAFLNNHNMNRLNSPSKKKRDNTRSFGTQNTRGGRGGGRGGRGGRGRRGDNH